MKVHLGLSLLSLGAGWVLGLAAWEWVAVFLAMGLVFSAEIFNTVVEELLGMVSPEGSVKVRRIKDMAAGAVLIAALSAVAVAFAIFPLKILSRVAAWIGWSLPCGI